MCVGKKGLKVQPDILINNVNEKNFEGIIFIGGRGVLADINNSVLQDLASAFKRSNKVVAAICAAPLILGNAGMLTNIEATCNKNYRNDLEDTGAKYSEVPAVRSGNIITAQDPESAKDFAALIVDQISK